MILAQKTVEDIFGKVKPPPGPSGLYTSDVGTGVGNLITVLLQILFIVASVFVLYYLLWGAFDWITSEGEKEKLEKARGKMIAAVVGLLMIIFALTIFAVITGNVLGIIDISNGGIKFTIPHL